MSAPAGWYPDPWAPANLRWFDGTTWTPHFVAPPPESAPTFDRRALRPALIGVVASVLAGRVITRLMLDHFGAPTELFIVTFYAIVFGGMWGTCRVVSRRYGTGNPLRDFRYTWQWSDLWRGLLVFFLTRVVQVIAMLPWAGHLDRIRRLTEGLERVSIWTFIIFAVVAVVGAPVIEELVFRGVIQQSLADRSGHGWAVPVQAVLFGLYHVTPGLGSTNVPYVVGLSAAGLVLGWAAWKWKRLGPGSAAHFFVNATSAAVLFSSR
jgi:membrane protease YdiL (CAAX protease family)